MLNVNRALGAASLLLLLAVADAHASSRGNADRGHAFARNNCSRCHAVEAHQLQSPAPEAPPFATLSRYRPLDDLAKSLSHAIMVGHAKYPMPVFQLGRLEIADLIAYLKTIQEPAPASPAVPAP